MDLELNGKKALVTGGSRGLGRAAAAQPARQPFLCIKYGLCQSCQGNEAASAQR